MRAGDLKVEREFGEGSVDFRGAADRVSLEEAAGFLLAHCQVIRETETVPLLDCTGRVLAEDVSAGFDNPPFDRSPVDLSLIHISEPTRPY